MTRKIQTKTFTLGNESEVYCGYYGEVADKFGEGSYYDFEWVFYCNCEIAEQEKNAKEKVWKLDSALHSAKEQLKQIQSEDSKSDMVRRIKYQYEHDQLKKKYNISN